jgi:hypothetical protein
MSRFQVAQQGNGQSKNFQAEPPRSLAQDEWVRVDLSIG